VGEPTENATGQHEDERKDKLRAAAVGAPTNGPTILYIRSGHVTYPRLNSDIPTMSVVVLATLRRSSYSCASLRNKCPARLYHEQSCSPPLGGIEPPLRGLRVVDLTRVLAGPTATMLLADLGADVIKVEEITRGDDTSSAFPPVPFRSAPRSRQRLSGSWNPPAAPLLDSAPGETSHLPPESAYFLSVNRNKRSITVDFKSPAGLGILHRMIKHSDVLVENFISGKLATFGLGWDDCRKINPRLIYTSITGNKNVTTSPASTSLTPTLKGTVRQDHTERLLDTMSLSKAKVQ